MSKKNRSKPATGAARPKQQSIGAAVPVSVRRDGSRIQLQINAADLPDPVLVGYADRCAILERDFGAIEIRLAEADPLGPRAVVRIVVTRPALKTSIVDINRAFMERLGDIASVSMGEGQAAAAEFSMIAPVCNLVRVSRTDNESLLECYFLYTHSVALVKRGAAEQPTVVPLFGVQMATPLLATFLRKLRDIVDAEAAQ